MGERAELPTWVGESLDTAPGEVRRRLVERLELVALEPRPGAWLDWHRWLARSGLYAEDGGPVLQDGSVLALFRALHGGQP